VTPAVFLNCDGDEVQIRQKDAKQLLTIADFASAFLDKDNGHFYPIHVDYLPGALKWHLVGDGSRNCMVHHRSDERMVRLYPSARTCVLIMYGSGEYSTMYRDVHRGIAYLSSDATYFYRSFESVIAQKSRLFMSFIESLPSFFKEQAGSTHDCPARKSKFYTYDFQKGVEEMCQRGKDAVEVVE